MPLPGRHSDLGQTSLLDDFLPSAYSELLQGQLQNEDFVISPSGRERIVPETFALVVLDFSFAKHSNSKVEQWLINNIA